MKGVNQLSKEEDIIIGGRIHTIRTSTEINLTMEKFGERLGVGKTAINKLEKAENHLTKTMFNAICREFNVSEEWLRDGIGDMFVIPEDETAALVEDLLTDKDNVTYRAILSLVKTYQQLSPESKKIVDNFIHDAIENEKNREA